MRISDWSSTCALPISPCQQHTPVSVSLDQLSFDNRFARLGDAYSSRVTPEPLANPRLLHANAEVAALFDLDPAALHSEAFVDIFAGNRVLAGAEPVAALYAGHQLDRKSTRLHSSH